MKLHGLTDDGQGAWVTMHYANGWARKSLWPLEDGQVMQGWPPQDRYSLAPGVLDHLNEAIHAGQVEKPSDKPDMRLSDFITLITEVIAAEVHRRGVPLSATDEIVTLGKQLRFCPPQSD